MPFIGKDWRSPGEEWVKTDEGSWEKKKILETTTFGRNNNQAGFHSSCEDSTESDSDSDTSSSSGAGDDLVPYADAPSSKASFVHSQPKPIQQGGRRRGPTPPSCEECPRSITESPTLMDSVARTWPPHCQITLKCTKEVAGYNTISEALHRLDFSSAILDIRRFHYVTKMLHLLINQNMTSLSGCATKVIFTLLEQLTLHVVTSRQNIHVLHTLLEDLKKIINSYYCWGRPLGSTQIWEQHLQTLDKLMNRVAAIEIKEPTEDGSKRLSDLPEELIREILLRLSDYKDLINSSEAYDVMNNLLDEQHVWRELCKYHFQEARVTPLENKLLTPLGKTDWEQVFHVLRRKHGLREEYPDTLVLCRYCRCLFWQSFGHPCVICDDLEVEDKRNQNESPGSSPSPIEGHKMVPLHIPVPPQAFLKFFNL